MRKNIQPVILSLSPEFILGCSDHIYFTNKENTVRSERKIGKFYFVNVFLVINICFPLRNERTLMLFSGNGISVYESKEHVNSGSIRKQLLNAAKLKLPAR